REARLDVRGGRVLRQSARQEQGGEGQDDAALLHGDSPYGCGARYGGRNSLDTPGLVSGPGWLWVPAQAGGRMVPAMNISIRPATKPMAQLVQSNFQPFMRASLPSSSGTKSQLGASRSPLGAARAPVGARPPTRRPRRPTR